MTEDDLEVAEASVSFAMENCPVEGLLTREDGTSISLDDLQTLRGKLKEAENSPDHRIGEEAVASLRSVIDYTSENCPVEEMATFHDGRPISGRSIIALDEKLRDMGPDQPTKGVGASTP